MLLGKLNQLIVGDTSRTDQHHTVRSVVCLDVASQIIALDALDIFGRTKDSTSQRLSLESSCVQMIENNFFQLLVDLFGLPQDNVTLALNSLRLELGVLKDVGKNVDRGWDVCVKSFGIVYGVFTLPKN